MCQVVGVDIPVGALLCICMLYMSVLCVCICVFLNTNKVNCKCKFWNRIELFCVCTLRYLHGSLNFIFQFFLGMKLVSIFDTFPIPFKWLKPFPHFLCLWHPLTHPSPHPSPIVCIGTTFISTSSIYFSLVPRLSIPCFPLYTYSCLYTAVGLPPAPFYVSWELSWFDSKFCREVGYQADHHITPMQ